jgi:hypothetical protein
VQRLSLSSFSHLSVPETFYSHSIEIFEGKIITGKFHSILYLINIIVRSITSKVEERANDLFELNFKDDLSGS